MAEIGVFIQRNDMRPQGSPKPALHKLGVGRVKFPISPKEKRGALLVWNGLRSMKTHKARWLNAWITGKPVTALDLYSQYDEDLAERDRRQRLILAWQQARPTGRLQ